MEGCFVGADVHMATTTFHVLDEAGKFQEEAVLPTTMESIVGYLSKLPRPIALAFEEGTQAQWLHGLLLGRVDRLVVADPAKNRSIWSAKPNDSSDAHMLDQAGLHEDIVDDG
jgi:hypothetical protein